MLFQAGVPWSTGSRRLSSLADTESPWSSLIPLCKCLHPLPYTPLCTQLLYLSAPSFWYLLAFFCRSELTLSSLLHVQLLRRIFQPTLCPVICPRAHPGRAPSRCVS